MKHAMRRAAPGLAKMLLATTILAPSALPAMADTHRIAYSEKLKVGIEASGGANWCAPQLTLYMTMDPTSPLVGHVPSQLQLMNRLGAILPSQCPQALAAEVIAQVTNNGANTVVGSYVASGASHWQFSAPTQAAPPMPAPQSAAPQANAVPVPVPAVAPAAAAPTSAFVLPAYINYQAVLLHYLKDNPAEASDPQMIQWWTAQTLADQYQAVQFQQFKLQSVLQAGQAKLDQALAQLDDSAVVLLQVSLGAYDFTKNQYPLSLNDNISIGSGFSAPASPINTIQVNADLETITGVPMSQSEAEAYEAARTDQSGNVNRNVIIAIKLDFKPGAFFGQPVFNPTANATVESAAIYAPNGPFGQNVPSKETPIAIITAGQIAAIRDAKQKADEEAVQAQRLEQKASDIQEVSGFTNDEKLYNWLNDSQITTNTLDNMGHARFSVLLNDHPMPVSMLVETNGSGKQNVATAWPGKLVLNAANNAPAFAGSTWYLVSGNLTTSTKPGDLISMLDVTDSYQCTQNQCAEALDPTAIVNRYDATQLNH